MLSILLGILSPSLRFARRQTRSIMNMSRQKGVLEGVLAYSVDNSDRLPESVATIGIGMYWNWTEPMMLTGYRARSPVLHRSMSAYLGEYIPDASAMFCPNAPSRYPYLQEAWDAGDLWDHPMTEPVQDPLSGTYCFWWNYRGYLADSDRMYIGPSTTSENGMLTSDYFGYDHWRNPYQFSSCERFDRAEINTGTLLSSSWWKGDGITDEEGYLLTPRIVLRASFLDGHVETYPADETSTLRVIWKVETGEPYPSGIGPGEIYIPFSAVK